MTVQDSPVREAVQTKSEIDDFPSKGAHVNLYILRHGEAESIGSKYPSDAARPLTPVGRERVEQSTSGMMTAGVSVGKIVSSPLLRARQTAEIVHKGLEVTTDLEFSDALATGDIGRIVNTVRAHASSENVMLVGHEPTFSRLISVLASGVPDTVFDLQPGGLCKLTLESLDVGQCAAISWLLTPVQLASLRE